jgi:hypothetical protein
MVGLEEQAVVAALDLRWLSSSATFSTFTAGCPVVLTLDPAGCTVVTRMG